MKSKILLTFIVALALQGNSQTITNIKTTFDGEKVIIVYDLSGVQPTDKFKVSIFSSHDSYSRPLSLVTGDVGETVSSGKGNRVIWDAKNTLSPTFDDDIIIKIKAGKAVLGGLSRLTMKPLASSTYKRKKKIDMQWMGGKPDDKINIYLYKGDQVKLRVAEKVDNKQTYSWQMPGSVKKGKNYTVKIANANEPTETSDSQTFRVKPKVPFIVKMLPLIGGGIYALISSLGGGDPGETPDSMLPGPIKPN
jgi:hypothetical protein